jgi:hypothetical protein
MTTLLIKSSVAEQRNGGAGRADACSAISAIHGASRGLAADAPYSSLHSTNTLSTVPAGMAAPLRFK